MIFFDFKGCIVKLCDNRPISSLFTFENLVEFICLVSRYPMNRLSQKVGWVKFRFLLYKLTLLSLHESVRHLLEPILCILHIFLHFLSDFSSILILLFICKSTQSWRHRWHWYSGSCRNWLHADVIAIAMNFSTFEV